MAYEVEVSNEFRDWYEVLTVGEQLSIEHVVLQLAEVGPALGFPQSSGVRSAQVSHMRELRVQHGGRPYRILYAFNPERAAYLILGGDKTGDDRWYEVMVPKAEAIYARYLKNSRSSTNRRRVADATKGSVLMATNWKDLKHKAAPELREQVRRDATAALERFGYGALRKARDLTQVEVAERLNIPQSAVSRLESQSDLLVSTLAKYIRAMGGELQMQAVFPGGTFDLAPPLASIEPGVETPV